MEVAISVICKLTFPEGERRLYNEAVTKPHAVVLGLGTELMALFPLRHVCELGCPRSPFIRLPQKHMEPPYARPQHRSPACPKLSFLCSELLPPVCSRVPPTVPQAALLTAEEADIKLWVYKLSRRNLGKASLSKALP